MAVKGLGLWTAQMFLMFHLERPDVLPVGDLGIRRAIERAYALDGLPQPADDGGIALPWRPHRTLACRYLWRSLADRAHVRPRHAWQGRNEAALPCLSCLLSARPPKRRPADQMRRISIASSFPIDSEELSAVGSVTFSSPEFVNVLDSVSFAPPSNDSTACLPGEPLTSL